jgi:hypothetical protein
MRAVEKYIYYIYIKLTLNSAWTYTLPLQLSFRYNNCFVEVNLFYIALKLAEQFCPF